MTAVRASRADGRMFRPAVALALVALVASAAPAASAAGPDWPGFQKDAMHTGLQTGNDLPDDLDIIWQVHLDGQVKSSPVVADGFVYMATEKGSVYGLDARNGKTLWGPVELAEPVVGTPSHENDRLYVATTKIDGSAGKIYVLDGATGASIMNVTLTKGSYAGVVIHDGKLFVGTDNGDVVAYDTETMTKLWTFSTAVKIDKSGVPEDGYGRPDCCLDTAVKAKPVKVVPLVFKDRVFFGSFNHQFFAVDSGGNPGAESTTLEWVENVHDIVYSSAAVGRAAHMIKDMVVVGSYDGRVYAFDTEPLGSPSSCPSLPERTYHALGNDCSDRMYWIYNTGSRVFASPAIANHRAYVGDEEGTFHSIWLESGNPAWSYKTGNTIRSSAAVLNNTIVVGSYDGKFYMFKEGADGKLLPGFPKTLALSDKIHSSPALAEDRVFVATQDGVIYALAAPGTAVPPGGPPATPLGDPDFQLQDLQLTPRKAVAGQPLEVAIAVHNAGGNAEGPVNLRLYNGDTLIDQADVEVGGGTAKVHSFVFTPQAGDLFLKLVVDENATITEAVEDNNVLQQHQVVEAGSAAPSPTEDSNTSDEGGEGEEEDEDVPAPPLALVVMALTLLTLAVRRTRRE